MARFQLHRRIPLVRRPFYQRDQAILERDNAVSERDQAILERDHAAREREQLEAAWEAERKQLKAAWEAERKQLNEKTLDAAIEAMGVHDVDLAATLFDEAIGPDQEAASSALVQYGIALAWVGRLGDAEWVLRLALKKEPNAFIAYSLIAYSFGSVLAEQRKYSEASSVFASIDQPHPWMAGGSMRSICFPASKDDLRAVHFPFRRTVSGLVDGSPGDRDFVYFVAADSSYAKRFARALHSSLAAVHANCLLHIHVINPDAATSLLLEYMKKRPGPMFAFSSEEVDLSGLSSALDVAYLVSDDIVLAELPPTAMLSAAPDADIPNDTYFWSITYSIAANARKLTHPIFQRLETAPLIIVIPVFDHSDGLERTIASVARDGYSNVAHVVLKHPAADGHLNLKAAGTSGLIIDKSTQDGRSFAEFMSEMPNAIFIELPCGEELAQRTLLEITLAIENGGFRLHAWQSDDFDLIVMPTGIGLGSEGKRLTVFRKAVTMK